MTTTAIHLSQPLVRPQPARPTRLSPAVYRRRRIATAVLGGLVVLAGARTADGVVAGAGQHAHDTTKVVQYHVQPGDTLWSIAHRLAPGDDPRAVVDLLVQAHGGPTIQPGDVIDWAGT